MRPNDLLFLAAFLFAAFLCIRLLVLALTGQWKRSANTVRWLLGFVCFYAGALLVTASLMPRRYLSPGERRCFDDWCIATMDARPIDAAGHWTITVEVASEAKRVRQREMGVLAELESDEGVRYTACQEDPAAKKLTDELGPGDLFQTDLHFCLPQTARVAGLVVRHGGFPGNIIIGDDESALHQPALMRLNVDAGLPQGEARRLF